MELVQHSWRAKQVHEVHVGGNATPGCSAATLGLSSARGGQVAPGRPAAPSCLRRKARGALPGPARLPSMWGTAAGEGDHARPLHTRI